MSVKPKLPGMSGGKSEGQLQGRVIGKQKFAEPVMEHSDDIMGMNGTHDDIGEKSGFQTTGYLDKKGTPYGEGAKFNFLPPGMDISDQENKDIRNMPLKRITEMSYPGDGWEPAPRDIPE